MSVDDRHSHRNHREEDLPEHAACGFFGGLGAGGLGVTECVVRVVGGEGLGAVGG